MASADLKDSPKEMSWAPPTELDITGSGALLSFSGVAMVRKKEKEPRGGG